MTKKLSCFCYTDLFNTNICIHRIQTLCKQVLLEIDATFLCFETRSSDQRLRNSHALRRKPETLLTHFSSTCHKKLIVGPNHFFEEEKKPRDVNACSSLSRVLRWISLHAFSPKSDNGDSPSSRRSAHLFLLALCSAFHRLGRNSICRS